MVWLPLRNPMCHFQNKTPSTLSLRHRPAGAFGVWLMGRPLRGADGWRRRGSRWRLVQSLLFLLLCSVMSAAAEGQKPFVSPGETVGTLRRRRLQQLWGVRGSAGERRLSHLEAICCFARRR